MILLAVFAMLSETHAQDKPLSPKETVEATIDGVKTTIVYSRPSARGRKMIGGKEPYGKVWRTGANKATTIEFSHDVLIEGKALPAGKYGLFTIPGADEWIIIFNKVHDQWGAFSYNESEDALRVKVKTSQPGTFVETFTIAPESDGITLKWENVQVNFSVKKK